jgi:hypothetical protein
MWLRKQSTIWESKMFVGCSPLAGMRVPASVPSLDSWTGAKTPATFRQIPAF